MRAGAAPYLALLDDDDTWAPDFLQRRVDFLERHPRCGLVFSTFVEVDRDGVELNRGDPPFGPPGVYEPDRFVPALIRSLSRQAHRSKRRIFTAMLTTLVRRDALEAVGGAFDERLPISADCDLWLRLAACRPVGYLHSWDASYRVHAMQDSASSSLLERDVAELLRRLEHGAYVGPELLPEPAELRRQRAIWLLPVALDEAQRGDRRPAVRLLSEAVRISPGRLLDPRVPATLAGLVLGRRAGPALDAARALAPRRRSG